MVYVFDTSSLRVLKNYFPDRFPTFWDQFDEAVVQGSILSVREVHNELKNQVANTHLKDWIKNSRQIFLIPSQEEMEFVSKIFTVPHFRYLVAQRQRLQGTPVADPFVIASAKIRAASVVTEESRTEKAARIPNVCEHFQIDWTNLEGFMERQGWEF